MIKLFILALVLIVGGAIVGMTTTYNPTLLIVAGFVCGGIAALREADQMPMRIAAEDGQTSPGAETEARQLANYHFPTRDTSVGPFTTGG
jgi:hypothetical protein